MAIPVVAIIGRPNVGKSSLLNALAGKRISIVEATAGVTRDRVSAIIEKNDKYLELIDTGGYGIVDSDHLSSHIESQIHQAILTADLVLFIVDIRDGIVPLDKEIARLLRAAYAKVSAVAKAMADKPADKKENLKVIGVANKADSAKMFPAAGEFAKLGFGEFLCVSATNNLNKTVLLEKILAELEHIKSTKPAKPIMKLAIVGKRNSGKSTLVNAIVGSERVIVSETPGTTRDAVDIRFEKDGKTIVVIDTAGVRKKNKMADSIEFYSYVRAAESIRRADVVMFLIDAAVPVSQVDKKLAKLIAEEYKSCIIVINKWDLAKDTATTEDYEDYLTKMLPGLKYAPIAFTTATEAKNVQTICDLAAEIFKQTITQIPTPKLNKVFEIIKAERVGATKRRTSGWPKIYYTTQIAVNPITILMFVNRPELFEENYMRFITGRLKSMLPIAEVPIKLLVKPHRK